MTVVRRVTTLVAACLVLAACGASDAAVIPAGSVPDGTTAADAAADQTGPMASTPPVVADGPVVAEEASATMPDALVPAQVVLESGCIRLRIESVGTVVAVWPAGARWDADSVSVLLDDGRRIGVGDHVEGGLGYDSAAAIGEVMPTILDDVLACLPDGVDATSGGQVVLIHQPRVIDGRPPVATGPAGPADPSDSAPVNQPTVLAAEPDASDSCLPVPVIELVGIAGRLTMDLINYSEHMPPCGLDVDGDAMFDDEFRPAEALVVPDGELAIAPDQAGVVSVDIRPLDRRAAGTGVSGDALTAASDGTYPLTVPAGGCFVVTVSWQAQGRGGAYIGLVESSTGSCHLE